MFYFHEQLTNLFFKKYVDGCLFFSQHTQKWLKRMEYAAGLIMAYFLKLVPQNKLNSFLNIIYTAKTLETIKINK